MDCLGYIASRGHIMQSYARSGKGNRISYPRTVGRDFWIRAAGWVAADTYSVIKRGDGFMPTPREIGSRLRQAADLEIGILFFKGNDMCRSKFLVSLICSVAT